MPLYILLFAIQVLCAVHVIQTGRDKYWIFIIIIAPGIGSLAYVVTQVLPDAGKTRTAGNLKSGAVKVLDPMREYREAKRAFDMLESVENHLRLADALIGLGRWQEAEPYIQTCLMGIGAKDPYVLMRMASVKLALGQPDKALECLDHLQATNKGFQSQEGHLLYARAQADTGDTVGALASYADLIAYATGEEARVRYARLLEVADQGQAAKAVYGEVVARGKRATSHYRKTQKAWIAEAQRKLVSL